jgi:hypothetical protein
MRKITNLEIKECFKTAGIELKPLALKIKHVISANTENAKSYILSRVNTNLKLEDFLVTHKVSLCDQELSDLNNKLGEIIESLGKWGISY